MRYLLIIFITLILFEPSVWSEEMTTESLELGDPVAQEMLYQEPQQKSWEFFVLPAAWITGVYGEVSVNDNDVRVNTTIGEIFEDLDDLLFDELYVFVGRVEARYDRWTLIFEGDYVYYSEEQDRNIIDTRVEAELGIAQLALGYRFFETPLGENGDRTFSLGMLAGARYYYLDLDIEVDILGLNIKADRNRSWIDPFVGSRLQFQILKWLTLDAKATIGGFKVGSDLSWGFTALFNIQPTKHISIIAGYGYLDTDYSDGGKDFQFDIILHGPIVGLGFHF